MLDRTARRGVQWRTKRCPGCGTTERDSCSVHRQQLHICQRITRNARAIGAVGWPRIGSYLSACVFYAVLTQQSPEGLGYVAGLSEELGRFLQLNAAEIVLEETERWNIR
jgi:hypothetical protein